MRRIAIALAFLTLAACTTAGHSPTTAPVAINTPQPATLADGAQPVQPASTEASNPEASGLLSLQDRLNVLASPKYLADVAAAKAGGADALQVACMDATMQIGADLKAKPLIVIPSLDLGPVDRSCGWCVLAAQRKSDAERRNGPSLLVRIADGRKRVQLLARNGLVACAPLKEDVRLSLLNPENAAADLLGLLSLFGGK
jgi:hypothetical protein